MCTSLARLDAGCALVSVRAIRSAALCGVDVDLHRVCRRLLERLQQEPGVILGVVRRPVLAELEHMRDVVLVLAVDLVVGEEVDLVRTPAR